MMRTLGEARRHLAAQASPSPRRRARAPRRHGLPRNLCFSGTSAVKGALSRRGSLPTNWKHHPSGSNIPRCHDMPWIPTVHPCARSCRFLPICLLSVFSRSAYEGLPKVDTPRKRPRLPTPTPVPLGLPWPPQHDELKTQGSTEQLPRPPESSRAVAHLQPELRNRRAGVDKTEHALKTCDVSWFVLLTWF